jgi:hypothetical protein
VYLRERMEELRRGHYVCDDCWYSCPKSGECCNCNYDNSKPPECNCGADKHNEIIDKILEANP